MVLTSFQELLLMLSAFRLQKKLERCGSVTTPSMVAMAVVVEKVVMMSVASTCISAMVSNMLQKNVDKPMLSMFSVSLKNMTMAWMACECSLVTVAQRQCRAGGRAASRECKWVSTEGPAHCAGLACKIMGRKPVPRLRDLP